VSDTRDATVADVSDSTFTLNPAVPQVFINEYLPQPNNAPGMPTPDYDQMFVELLNTGTTAVNLSGWRLHDDASYSGAPGGCTPPCPPASPPHPAGAPTARRSRAVRAAPVRGTA
jgi:hypothetical protein